MTDNRAADVLKSVKEQVNGDPVMVAKLSRVSGATYLFIEVADAIEDLFRTDRVNDSTEWSDGNTHHAFYQQRYSNELRDFMQDQYDDYGSTILDSEGRINAAVFRTVGLSDGKTFKIDGPHTETALKESVRELRRVAEDLYNTFLSTTVLVAEVKQLDVADVASTGGA